MDALLDTAPCGYLGLADDGTVVAANGTLLDLVGRAREAVEGRHVESLLTTPSRIFYQTHLFPLVRMHGHAEEIYLTLRARDDRSVPVLVNAKRMEHGGSPLNALVLLPIQRRQEFEDALLAARRSAEAAAESRARFLATLAHEIRTPLNGMLGYVDLLDMGIDGELNDSQRERLERVRTAGGYLVSLLEDVLELSRLEAKEADLRLAPVSLDEVIAEAESLVAHRMDDAGITYRREGCACAVRADPERLQQVLLNLLTNAVKYAAPGRVEVLCERDEEHVLVHVTDTGPGIPADQIGRIFEPFVQLGGGRGRSGVGLGLGISRELVRNMGGDLSVRSVEGEGSVFTVALRVP